MNMDDCSSQPNSDWFFEKPPKLRTAAVWTGARFAAGMQRIRGNQATSGFTILMYHRVSERFSGVAAPTHNVTPDRLRRQLTGLLQRGFVAWPLSRFLHAERNNLEIPPNAFAVTFDDGYENNYLSAWLVLRELNVPATIFLATKYLDSDQPFPFDDWPAAGTSRVPSSSWRPLSTWQCQQMLEDGLIELGAHTHSHQRFLGRRDDFLHDLQECLHTLQERFGITKPTFAFPYGDMSAELIAAARQLGVSCCLSTQHRRIEPNDEPYPWGRFYIGQSDSPAVVAAKVSGWYSRVISSGKRITMPFATLTHKARAYLRNPFPVDHQTPKTSARTTLPT
jgi:peptidoglycan/xylan/chitin deacetylase (PgdA/CDA1 family)